MCISYKIVSRLGIEQQQQRNRGGRIWSIKKMDYKELERFLRLEVLQTNLGTGKADYVLQYTSSACDACMPRLKFRTRQTKNQVHWWTAEIEELRRASNTTRRKYQRAAKRSRENCEQERETAKQRKKELRRKIRRSQKRSWKEFCNSVDNDP